MNEQTKEERQQRPSPSQKKQEDYDRERIVCAEYPHRHRRCYPLVKDRFQRMERHIAQQLVQKAIDNEDEDISNALLQTVALRCRGPRKGAPTLRLVVEIKLARRVEKHGARKRRQGLPYSPQSQPKLP